MAIEIGESKRAGAERASSALYSRGNFGGSLSPQGSPAHDSPGRNIFGADEPNVKPPPPLRHELRRKQEARLINIENAQLARRLMGLRVSKDLSCKAMLEDFEKHLRAKANLCKLPIINMSHNSFSTKNNFNF